MTQTTSRFFDELAKVMTNAAGAAQGVRHEIDAVVRAQMERVLGNMDVVQREEFEAVREMAVLAREQNEILAKRIANLEAAKPARPAKPTKPAKPAKPVKSTPGDKPTAARAKKAAGKSG
ncbi:MAG: accessory factor UbiK family protein [Alphaproteobacteria bacterium]